MNVKKFIFKYNDKKINDNFEDYIDKKYDIHPYSQAVKFSIIYVIIGILWILVSDMILSLFKFDGLTYLRLETYKGWFYVVISTIIVFVIILRRLLFFKKAVDKIHDNFDRLNNANEELVSMEEELKQQLNEIESNRNAISTSQRRYNMALDAANCVIWEWNIKKGKFYISPN